MNLRDPFLMPTMLRAFGYGVPTGLTDIAEDAGSIGDPDTYRQKTGLQWSFIDAVSMAIGQGEVEVTPLQMVRLTAAVANGGDLLKPFIVQKAGLFDDFSYEAAPDVMANLDVEQNVMDAVREGMCEVTTIYQDRDPISSTRRCQPRGVRYTGQRRNCLADNQACSTAYAPKDDPESRMSSSKMRVKALAVTPLVRDIMEYYFSGSHKACMKLSCASRCYSDTL